MKNKFRKYIFIILLFSSSFAECDYAIGDFNNDNILNVLDIIALVNSIIDEDEFSIVFDLNFDSINNIADIIILVNRIIDNYPVEITIEEIDYDFETLTISWSQSTDYGFEYYNINYFNIISQESEIIHTSTSISDTTINLLDFVLKEQNWFYISVIDFLGCETSGNQFYYELPYKQYSIDSLGNIINGSFELSDFNSAEDCQSCHATHYEEWSESMHAYAMKDPLFFSCKNQTLQSHPEVGEKFCIQCHSPVAFLTGTETSTYTSVEEFQNSELPNVIKEGVSCDVCHTATSITETIHTPNSGAATANYKLYPGENIKFGPIESPESNNFHNSFYLPTYQVSEQCLPCHDLVVRDVEAEITFTEWNRIPGFSMFGGVACQVCHMPEKEDGTHDHGFIGADLDLNIPYLSNPEYEKVINLMNSAVTMEFDVWGIQLPETVNSGDTLLIPLTVESITAHNIPSGASFNRDVWVELKVSSNNEIIYSSGLLQNNSEFLNYNDENLLSFKTYLLDENGDTTRSVIDVHDIINNSLAPYAQRFKQYNIHIPENISGEISVQARMLFRPFSPDFILNHHPSFIENLPIYEMSVINSIIEVE